jgi:CheY-like chemotaxis protein
VEETLVFVYSDDEAAEQASAPFTARGHVVEILSPEGEECLDKVAEAKPMAVVLDISDDWMTPLVIAQGILADERLSRPLLVFVGGSADSITQCKATLPFGVYVKPEELVWVLKRLGLQV